MKNNNIFKKLFFEFSVVIFTVIIIFVMYIFNDVVTHIRFMELKVFLSRINREESNIDYMSMLMKYKLHKKLYENRIDERKLDKEELKMTYLLSSRDKEQNIESSRYKILSIPTLYLINFLRLIRGKDIIQTAAHDTADNFLDLAYYYERKKYYKKALEVYDKALSNSKKNNDKKPTIILHQGYCFSILGDFENAEKKYLSVIKDYNNEEVSITAAILLRYIQEFKSEIDRIKKSDYDSFKKSEKLYKLIAYKDALEVLETIDSKDEKELEKIKFYKARIFEETNKKKESIKLYQEIIINDQKSEFAKLANRRILVIASTDDKKDKLKKLVEKNNILIKDKKLEEYINVYEKIDIKKNEEITKSAIENLKIADDAEKYFSEDDMFAFAETSIEEDIIFGKDEIEEFIEDSVKEMETKIVRENQKEEKTKTKKTVKKNKYRNVEYLRDPDTGEKTGEYFVKYKDKKGRLYKSIHYDKNNKIKNTYIYIYDKDGAATIQTFDANGNLLD